MKQLIVFFLSSLFMYGTASADCPRSLDATQLAECIKVEADGANYQEWKSGFDQQQASEQIDDDDGSMISKTVPGADVRKITPAAGQPAKKTQDY
jgi:hypothetical protein